MIFTTKKTERRRPLKALRLYHRFAPLFLAFVLILSSFAALVGPALPSNAQAPATKHVQNLSTGHDSACAVVDRWPYCWGCTESGKLGTGSTATALRSTPVAVSDTIDAVSVSEPSVCTFLFIICLVWTPGSVKVTPASVSPMRGKHVDKVSVGATHACAIAEASVYCWGDNSHGQLGNRSNTDSAGPVKVDISGALKQKEIIDISAGDNFTCALASDGLVVCWGYGAYGQLGNNGTASSSSPVSVYMAGALAGKKGIRLAKVSSYTMCVLAINSNDNDSTAASKSYCWGSNNFGEVGNGGKHADYTYGKTETSSSDGGNRYAAERRQCAALEKRILSPQAVRLDYYVAQPVAVKTDRMFKDAYTTGITAGTTNGLPSASGATTAVSDEAYWWGGYAVTTRKFECKSLPGGSTGGQSGPGVNKWKSRATMTYTVHYYSYLPTKSGYGSVMLASGNAYNGLFCATTTTGALCDTHGRSALTNGWTGSNYACWQEANPSGVGKITKCPDPKEPQRVFTGAGSFLDSKTITALSVSQGGFTCAIAEKSLGCWGENKKGQLGTGDTTNRILPTAVGL